MLGFGRQPDTGVELCVDRPKGRWVRLDHPEALIGTGLFRDEITEFAQAARQAVARGRAVALDLEIRTDMEGDVTAILLRGTVETRGLLGLRTRIWSLGFLPAEAVAQVARDLVKPRRPVAADLVKLDLSGPGDPVVVVTLLAPPGVVDLPPQTPLQTPPLTPRPAPRLVVVR